MQLKRKAALAYSRVLRDKPGLLRLLTGRCSEQSLYYQACLDQQRDGYIWIFREVVHDVAEDLYGRISGYGEAIPEHSEYFVHLDLLTVKACVSQ